MLEFSPCLFVIIVCLLEGGFIVAQTYCLDILCCQTSRHDHVLRGTVCMYSFAFKKIERVHFKETKLNCYLDTGF